MIIGWIIVIMLIVLILVKLKNNGERFKTVVTAPSYASKYLDKFSKYHKTPYDFYELYGDDDKLIVDKLIDGEPEWNRTVARRNHIPIEENEYKFIS